MPNRTLGRFLHLLLGARLPQGGPQGDSHLLERFAAHRDAAAFEALLQRHGPMVWGVCRRVLFDPNDVDDAFQATFLVLVRKAHAIAKRESLGSWLHGVAHRVALRAKSQAATRRRFESEVLVRDTSPADDLTWKELRSALDAELCGLPEKLRQPLILCYLEGRTQDEAAQELGWSKSTLRRRLSEARDALGQRLVSRGVALSAALSAILVSDCLASGAPAPALVAATVDAAASVAAGTTVTAAASAKVAALTKGVMKAMLLSQCKTVAAVLVLSLGFLVGGGTLLRYQTVDAQEPIPAAEKRLGEVPATPPDQARDGGKKKAEPPKALPPEVKIVPTKEIPKSWRIADIADARVLPSGLNATDPTQPVCPLRVVRSLPLATSHNFSVPS